MRYDTPAAGADRVGEFEVPYTDGRPDLPWAAAAAKETPCPGEPDLVLVTRARKPHWEGSEAGRYIPAGTRKHVQRRDGFRCACPDCPHRVWLDLHHVVFWCRGGLSVPENLCVVCTKCHANVHKGRLFVSGNAEKGLLWTDRWGRRLGDASPERRREAAALAREMLREAVGREVG